MARDAMVKTAPIDAKCLLIVSKYLHHDIMDALDGGVRGESVLLHFGATMATVGQKEGM
jgi:hypothetical protein